MEIHDTLFPVETIPTIDAHEELPEQASEAIDRVSAPAVRDTDAFERPFEAISKEVRTKFPALSETDALKLQKALLAASDSGENRVNAGGLFGYWNTWVVINKSRGEDGTGALRTSWDVALRNAYTTTSPDYSQVIASGGPTAGAPSIEQMTSCISPNGRIDGVHSIAPLREGATPEEQAIDEAVRRALPNIKGSMSTDNIAAPTPDERYKLGIARDVINGGALLRVFGPEGYAVAKTSRSLDGDYAPLTFLPPPAPEVKLPWWKAAGQAVRDLWSIPGGLAEEGKDIGSGKG